MAEAPRVSSQLPSAKLKLFYTLITRKLLKMANIAVQDPLRQCADPAPLYPLRHSPELLHCGVCDNVVCRSCSDQAFRPAGTASRLVYQLLQRLELDPDGPLLHFRCHTCADENEPPRSLVDQLRDAGADLNPLRNPPPLNAAFLAPPLRHLPPPPAQVGNGGEALGGIGEGRVEGGGDEGREEANGAAQAALGGDQMLPQGRVPPPPPPPQARPQDQPLQDPAPADNQLPLAPAAFPVPGALQAPPAIPFPGILQAPPGGQAPPPFQAPPVAPAPGNELQQLMGAFTQMMTQNQQLIQQMANRNQPQAMAAAQAPPLRQHQGLLHSALLHNASPKLFNGSDHSEFPGFWTTFQSRIRDTQLSETEKFVVLESLLEGSARRKIAGLQAHQAGAFAEAAAILEANYSDRQEHKASIIRRLLSLPHLHEMTFDSLDEWTDQLRLASAQLRNLGEPAAAMDSFAYVLWPRLPSLLQGEIRDQRARLGLPLIPSIPEMIAALDLKLKTLRFARTEEETEVGEMGREAFSGSSLLAHARRGQQPQKAPLRSNKVASASEDRKACLFCDQSSHESRYCGKVVDHSARLRIVRQKSLCRNCLRSGHKATDCGSRWKCRAVGCGQSHHTCLHQAFGSLDGSEKGKEAANGASSQSSKSKQKPPLKKHSAAVLGAAVEEEGEESGGESMTSLVSASSGLSPTILVTFKAFALNPATGEKMEVRVLVDNASSYTHVSDRLVRELGLKKLRKGAINAATFGSSSPSRVSTDLVGLALIDMDGAAWPFYALSIRNIAAPIHLSDHRMSSDIEKILTRVSLPIANRPGDGPPTLGLDVLLGGNYAQLLIGPSVPALSLRPTLSVHLSRFGALLTGSEGEELGREASGLVSSCEAPVWEACGLLSGRASLEQLLERTSCLEALGIAGGAEKPNLLEDSATRQLLDSTTRDPDGRYTIAIPLKDGIEHLPSNFGQALGRSQATHRRLSLSQRKEYYAEFEKRKEEGVLVQCLEPDQPISKLIHFLPHFPVYKYGTMDSEGQREVEKIRPVLDASARTSLNGASLNSYCRPAPDCYVAMHQVLNLHRVPKYVLSSDLRAAFYSIGIVKAHQDLFRVLLPSDISLPLEHGNFQVWKFTRLVMGASPSPWILYTILTRVMEDAVGDGDSGLEETELRGLLASTYVDNVSYGCTREEDLQKAVLSLTSLFKKSGFHLREFASNVPSALENLPVDDCLPDKVVGFLGVKWDTEEDLFHPKRPELPSFDGLDRAGLCSAAHTAFDPFGIGAPIILGFRLLNRRAFTNGAPWNAKVEEELREEYDRWKLSVSRLPEARIPRRLVPEPGLPARLVIFSDANLDAYGFVMYVQQELGEKVSVTFALAKARLAPSSSKGAVVTVPRMELWAALIASRAASNFISQLNGRLNFSSVTHFVDSQVVLFWIANGARLRQYESKRVQEIHDLRLTQDRRYIPSAQNPADLCTKPLHMSPFLKSPFLRGPQFLQSSFHSWPNPLPPPSDPLLSEGCVTGKKKKKLSQIPVSTLLSATPVRLPSPVDARLSRFERLGILLGATALAKRFLCREAPRPRGSPCFEERETALYDWIRWSQATSYAKVLTYLLSPDVGPQPKLVKQLDLHLDEKKLIRLGSRFANAHDFDQDLQFPLLLPALDQDGGPHRLSRLICLDLHHRHGHASLQTTLNLVRQRFWIPKGRVFVSHSLRFCFPCQISKGKPFAKPRHGSLPSDRLSVGQPAFSSVLIDQLGPLTVFDRHKAPSKRWILLITCATSRGLHMELLSDYSAEAVVNAFERFWARRGLTECRVYLDQATAFQAAAKALSSLLQTRPFSAFFREALTPLTQARPLRFIFSPVRGPWTQGAVERLVGMVKTSLRPILWGRRLSEDNLLTVILQIEAALNSRPLYPASEDPSEPLPITPASLLSPRAFLGLPASSASAPLQSDSATVRALLAAHRRRETLLEDWWARWMRDYVPALRQRHLRERRKPGPQPGPLVGGLYLIAEPRPRGCWKLGRCLAVNKDSQNVVRSAVVRAANGHEALLPASHLVPLEMGVGKAESGEEETDESLAVSDLDASEDVVDEANVPSADGDKGLPEQLLSARALRAARRDLARQS